MASQTKGFTLLELLVVISVISLLSSVIFASVASARDKAQVSALIQHFRQMKLALEIYKDDNGYYPYENDPSPQYLQIQNDGNPPDALTPALTTTGTYLPVPFLPNYISRIPRPLKYTGVRGNRPNNIITYMNNTKILSDIQQYGWTNLSCGGILAKGFMLYYYDYEGRGLPLPRETSANSLHPDEYCITGN